MHDVFYYVFSERGRIEDRVVEIHTMVVVQMVLLQQEAQGELVVLVTLYVSGEKCLQEADKTVNLNHENINYSFFTFILILP